MHITLQAQEETDFDWFCADEAGNIGHFTTAGFKKLPVSVSGYADDLQLVTSYFRNGLSPNGNYKTDDVLAKEVSNSKDRTEKYLESFVTMASKGLFSFDIDAYLKPGICYFRVASPSQPLQISELPPQIRKIIERTVLQGRLLKESSRIPYSETLEI